MCLLADKSDDQQTVYVLQKVEEGEDDADGNTHVTVIQGTGETGELDVSSLPQSKLAPGSQQVTERAAQDLVERHQKSMHKWRNSIFRQA